MKKSDQGTYETETCVVFYMKLPDTKKEDVDLEMDSHKLDVKVKGRNQTIKSQKEIVPEKANAILKDGMLRVQVPKADN